MREQNVSLKLKIICAFLTLCFIISIIGMFSRSGILPVTEDDVLSDKHIENISAETDYYNICAGDIVDNKGYPIQENISSGESGEVAEGYGLIVGYYDPHYGSYGLHGKYKEQMHSEYKNTGKGLSLKLTTDNGLQEYIYNQLKGRNASAVVLDRKSGKILSLVSTNSIEDFNPANIYNSKKMTEYNSIDSFWLPNFTLDEPAGSVMKIFTSAAMLEAGMENFTFDDTGHIMFNNGEIRNYNGVEYGNIGLKDSFVWSVNTYFATAVQKLGHYRIKTLSNKVLFNNQIDCDFGTISSYYNLGNTSYDLASAAYGQGKTLNSTLSLALMMQGICEQTIYKPHIVNSLYVYGKDGIKTIDNIDETVLSKNIVSKDTSKTIDELMLAASESYGLPIELGIRSKTGTAEVSEDEANANRATFVSYNDKYIVVLSEHKTEQFGISLADEAVGIYEYLSSLNNEGEFQMRY